MTVPAPLGTEVGVGAIVTVAATGQAPGRKPSPDTFGVLAPPRVIAKQVQHRLGVFVALGGLLMQASGNSRRSLTPRAVSAGVEGVTLLLEAAAAALEQRYRKDRSTNSPCGPGRVPPIRPAGRRPM